MNNATKIFLVLLRLAIGWHFLFEGIEKFQSQYAVVSWWPLQVVPMGATTTSKPFTSGPFLRNSSGPLGDFFRHQAGGLDEQALARLTVVPLAQGQDPAQAPPHTRMPPAQAQEWDNYLARFAGFYQIDDHQRDLAQEKLEQRKDQYVQWLLTGSKTEEKTYPHVEGPKVPVVETTQAHIQDYRDRLQEVRDLETRELPAFGRDVAHEKWAAAKAEVAQLRASLQQDLDDQTALTQKALDEVLTKEQRATGTVPEVKETTRLDWIDQVTMWLLLVVGACLLLGLCTRTACIGGAIFLIMIYVSMPPLPWIPETLRDEGHYLPLYVNKAVIEMLALLTLATTWSGRWLGLDGLLQFLNPWRWRSRRAPAPAPQTPAATRT